MPGSAFSIHAAHVGSGPDPVRAGFSAISIPRDFRFPDLKYSWKSDLLVHVERFNDMTGVQGLTQVLGINTNDIGVNVQMYTTSNRVMIEIDFIRFATTILTMQILY